MKRLLKKRPPKLRLLKLLLKKALTLLLLAPTLLLLVRTLPLLAPKLLLRLPTPLLLRPLRKRSKSFERYAFLSGGRPSGRPFSFARYKRRHERRFPSRLD